MQGIGKFDVKTDVIPNGLKKYIAFTVSNLVAIDSMQYMNFSIDALVKNLIMILGIYQKNLVVNF